MLLPHTSTFPFPLFNSLSHFYSKRISLCHGCSSTSPLHLPLSPSHLLNSLTASSPQLIISPFHLPLSPSHLLNSLTSSSFQLIAPPIFYLNPMLIFFFFSLCVVPMILLLFESQRCILSPLVSLFIFCCCIHLGVLSCMLLWIKLYKAILMFVVQSENITYH